MCAGNKKNADDIKNVVGLSTSKDMEKLAFSGAIVSYNGWCLWQLHLYVRCLFLQTSSYLKSQLLNSSELLSR